MKNSMEELVKLNTLSKLTTPKAKAPKRGPMTPALVETITTHARTVAKRGADLLDVRKPGWAQSAPDKLKMDRGGSVLIELGLIAASAVNEEQFHKDVAEFFVCRQGEFKFVSSFASDSERIAALLVYAMTGIGLNFFSPQEMSDAAHKEPGEIDGLHYGFFPHVFNLGMGMPASYQAKDEDFAALDAGNWCPTDAARILGAAWDVEIAARKGKS